MESFKPKSNNHECITNNELPAMSITDIILEFDQSVFWKSLPEAEIQVTKAFLYYLAKFYPGHSSKLCSSYGNV